MPFRRDGHPRQLAVGRDTGQPAVSSERRTQRRCSPTQPAATFHGLLLTPLASAGRLVATFEDGEALFDAACARALEGIVAKPVRDPYRPGERLWVKTKDRATARFTEERDGIGRRVKPRAKFVANY